MFKDLTFQQFFTGLSLGLGIVLGVVLVLIVVGVVAWRKSKARAYKGDSMGMGA